MTAPNSETWGATRPPLLPRKLEPLALPPAVNWPDDAEPLTWLYGLSDPRDGLLRVIGRSVMPHRASALDGVDAGAVPDTPSPRQEWGIELYLEHRFEVRHLLACVPTE